MLNDVKSIYFYVTLKNMRGRKKYIPYLFLSFLCLILLSTLVIFTNPNLPFATYNLNILPIIPFFILSFLIIFGIFSFVFKSFRRGILCALFIIAIILLQYLHINSLLYTFILILIVILLDLLFKK